MSTLLLVIGIILMLFGVFTIFAGIMTSKDKEYPQMFRLLQVIAIIPGLLLIIGSQLL
jgi:hypothetical protein